MKLPNGDRADLGDKLQDYDLIALTQPQPATHKQTQKTFQLQRGQIGTVLMSFDDEA